MHFSSQAVGVPFTRSPNSNKEMVFGRPSAVDAQGVGALIQAWPEAADASQPRKDRAVRNAKPDFKLLNKVAAAAGRSHEKQHEIKEKYHDAAMKGHEGHRRPRGLPRTMVEEMAGRTFGDVASPDVGAGPVVEQRFRKEWVSKKVEEAATRAPSRAPAQAGVGLTNAQMARYAHLQAKLNPRPDLPGHKLKKFTRPDITSKVASSPARARSVSPTKTPQPQQRAASAGPHKAVDDGDHQSWSHVKRALDVPIAPSPAKSEWTVIPEIDLSHPRMQTHKKAMAKPGV